MRISLGSMTTVPGMSSVTTSSIIGLVPSFNANSVWFYSGGNGRVYDYSGYFYGRSDFVKYANNVRSYIGNNGFSYHATIFKALVSGYSELYFKIQCESDSVLLRQLRVCQLLPLLPKG